MWIVAILCVFTVMLWYSNKRRGQRFVRAVHFLELLDGGASGDEANGRVARLFTKHSTPDADAAAIEYATDTANRLTEGKQLPWIDNARQRGFAIDSGDTRFDMAHLSQVAPQINPDQEFSEHFSEGQSTKTLGAGFPHTPPLLSKAFHTGFESIESNTDKVVPAIKATIRFAIRWAVRGAVAGFVLGLLTPVGVFGNLEVWAVPILTAYLGIFGGLAIGAVYRVIRWAFAN